MNIAKIGKIIILSLTIVLILILLKIDNESKKIKIDINSDEKINPSPDYKEELIPLSIEENKTIQTNKSNKINKAPEHNIYKKAITSFFWIGEEANSENNNIANYDSAWDDYWIEHYGGLDSFSDRCGYYPCSFLPKENPFYFALPYNDLEHNDSRKTNSKNISWYNNEGNKKSILKNKWIEIKYKNISCYAQWEDVGPNNENDFNYVFGNSDAKNDFGIRAGLDISPAVRDCLAMSDNDITEWRFVDFLEVPSGPWKNIITTRNLSR